VKGTKYILPTEWKKEGKRKKKREKENERKCVREIKSIKCLSFSFNILIKYIEITRAIDNDSNV